MSFDVAAESYDRFMGRYSMPLAVKFADFAGVSPGQRVLDVGCGPGALTAELVRRVGAGAVCAIDPSEPFVSAARQRLPGVDVRLASAERLPFRARAFDLALAQLVVHFMAEPVVALREMTRVTGEGGAVAACVWDFGRNRSPLSTFWTAAQELDPSVVGESVRPGTHPGHLAALFETAGLLDVQSAELSVSVHFDDFDSWWAPFDLGVGPVGDYVRRAGAERLAMLRERCRARFPQRGGFEISAVAWAARGRG